MTATIHPTAFVSPNAQIGQGVTIGPCALIEDDVIIGDNCRIDAFACIKQYTRMGNNNRIHSHAMVGGEPQDLKFSGEESWLEIGDHNTIREFATLHRGTAAGGNITSIGNNNLLMAYTHIAHDCRLGNHIVMSNAATLAGHVIIDDHAIIGGISAIHQFCHIGCHAFVGGMTGIGQDLPPYMLATGARAKIYGPNIVGLRRLGTSSTVVAAIKAAYRTFWFSGLPRPDALDRILAEHGDYEEIRVFVTFIRESSQRGILAAGKDNE